MQPRPLRKHRNPLWLPLLFVLFGGFHNHHHQRSNYSRHKNSCSSSNSSSNTSSLQPVPQAVATAASSTFFGASFFLSQLSFFFFVPVVDAQTQYPDKICTENRCFPGCTCTLPEDETERGECATKYGHWGFWPSDMDVEDPEIIVESWKKMDREYDLNSGTIQATGMRAANRYGGEGYGMGRIANITNTTLMGEVYFEIHPGQLSRNTGVFQESMLVELYAGGGLFVRNQGNRRNEMDFGLTPCTENIMLGHRLINMTGWDDRVENFDWWVQPFDNYNDVFLKEKVSCHPRSNNGRLAKLNFTLNDPFYYTADSDAVMTMWYPFEMDKNYRGPTPEYGSMEFCIHIELIDPTFVSENDDWNDDYFKKRNVTSFIDTKFRVDITEPTAENNWTRYIENVSEVKTYSSQDFGYVPGLATYLPLRYEIENFTKPPEPPPPLEIVIPLNTFRCSAPDESDVPGSYDPDRSYTPGQTFRLCVGPGAGFETDFEITGFENVICENGNRNLTLFDEFGMADNYTVVRTDTLGFTKKKGGIVTSSGIVSFDSTIREEIAGKFDGGLMYFSCTGMVIMDYVGNGEIVIVNGTALIKDTIDDEALLNATIADDALLNATTDGTVEDDEGPSSETSKRRRLRSHRNDYNYSNNLHYPHQQYHHHHHQQQHRHRHQHVPRYQYRFISRLLDEEDGAKDDGEEQTIIGGNATNITAEFVPIFGNFTFVVDISAENLNDKARGFFGKSMSKVKNWFRGSAAPPPTSMLCHNHMMVLGTLLGVLPVVLFA